MVCEGGAGGSGIEELPITQSQTNSNTNPVAPMSTGRGIVRETQPNVSRGEGAGESNMYEMNTGHSRNPGVYSLLLRQWLSQSQS
jgi:hypothetical protein